MIRMSNTYLIRIPEGENRDNRENNKGVCSKISRSYGIHEFIHKGNPIHKEIVEL